MENLPQSRVFENVTITPNGKTAAVLEGRWDDIYVTLINIRNDGRLVPYAHHPVDLPDGRLRLQVDLMPAPPATKRVIPVKPEKTKRFPRPSRDALQAAGLGLAAATGTAAIVGLVWGAVTVVPIVISFLATWALPALVLGIFALGIGAALESGHRKTATYEEEPSVGHTQPQAATETTVRRHWFTGKPMGVEQAKPQQTTPPQHHWLTGKPLTAETEEAVAEAKAEARDTVREQRRIKPIDEAAKAEIKYHWFTGKPVGIDVDEVAAEAKAEARDVAREQRHWWGGLKPEYHQTDELTTRILARMRNKNSGQAFGAWTGWTYMSEMADVYGDMQTAQAMHGDDKCGVQWMMHEVDPKDDRPGKKHGAWDFVNDRYGKKTIKNIVQMNDGGTRLPKIADYLEEQERRRAGG